MTAGLDNTVRVWDVRNLTDDRKSNSKQSRKGPNPVASFIGGRSINSSFFSPSGQYAVATSMENKLDIFENIHLSSSSTGGKSNQTVQPILRKNHDNMTGRWLTTFQATYHPSLDIFCVGSMQHPRAVEIFDTKGTLLRAISGDALTAVASRCCFHPRTDRIVMAGGSSSGRVSIFR
jgi:WD40 repeat protein